jgi:GNAT superfamily N-acetyltransferase
MWWRLRAAEWRAGKGAANRAALRRLVADGARAPGLLAYAGAECVGWIALAPRPDYPRLAGSRLLAAVDALPVWSITCFFVARGWRGRGVASQLVAGAVDFARGHGAGALEAYPVDTRGKRSAAVFVFTGTASLFTRAGFREVARRSPTRPIMRRTLDTCAALSAVSSAGIERSSASRGIRGHQ